MNLVRISHTRRRGAFTLFEMVLAVAIGAVVMAGLMTGSSLLLRNFAAVEAYATAEGNQLRVLDYIGRDVRHSLGVDAVSNVLTITTPDYYATGGPPTSSSVPVDPVVVNGAVVYGSTSLTIRYYQQGNSFYRSVNNVPTSIADDVADFKVTAQDLGATVTTTLVFSPRFRLSPSADAIAGTLVYSRVLLRNPAARQ